jgi:hypothetical protein
MHVDWLLALLGMVMVICVHRPTVDVEATDT